MTTLISLAARDFIAIGCDSLATASKPLVAPAEIHSAFFDSNGELAIGSDGKPLLKEASQIWGLATSLPINQLPSVTKLYDLKPMHACVLFAGTSLIGETTVRNLAETFKVDGRFLGVASSDTGSIEQLAFALKDFVAEIYEREISDETLRPLIEMIVSGYSKDSRQPEVWRILAYYDYAASKFICEARPEVSRGEYNIIFGGQYDVIQRIVMGVDLPSYESLRARTIEVLEECRKDIEEKLRVSGYGGAVPSPDFNDPKFDVFSQNWGGVSRLFADVGNLSEQAGIDFVSFLIEVMMRAHEFSNSIPTVGGGIHVALVTKNDGFSMDFQGRIHFRRSTRSKIPQCLNSRKS